MNKYLPPVLPHLKNVWKCHQCYFDSFDYVISHWYATIPAPRYLSLSNWRYSCESSSCSQLNLLLQSMIFGDCHLTYMSRHFALPTILHYMLHLSHWDLVMMGMNRKLLMMRAVLFYCSLWSFRKEREREKSCKLIIIQ